MGWAWWTSIFRFTLNKLRELDWRYVSPSNVYDWQFIRTQTGWSRADCIAKPDFYPCGGEYTKAIHRAGLYAYTFEGLVFAASIAAYFLLR